MLKKFLTTIIVLAATATAWADGWGVNKNYVTSGGNGNADGMNDYGISVITWSESESMTLADAITAANNATDYAGSPTYMIRIIGDISSEDQSVLSNIQKEKVDLSQVTGMTNFGVFAENTKVKYVILPDNTPKDDVDALGKTVDAAASKQTRRWEYEYKGVKYAYLGEVSNGSPVHGDSESAIIKLPVQVGEPTFKVKESEESYEGDIIIADNKFYGVSAENLKPLNTAPIGYIYNVDGVPFLYKGNVYMQNDQHVYYSDEEANRKELTMHENVYTYTVTEGETVTKHIYDGLTTVVDGKIYGCVGGTKYELSRGNEWFYSSNGTETSYNEYIREENGKTYGVFNYGSFIPVEYKEVYMDSWGYQVTTPVRKDEKENKYYACPNWGTFTLTKDGDNYKKTDGSLYEGNVYFDSEGQAYGIDQNATGHVYEVSCETRPVKEDGKVYDGKVYHDNKTPISYYGITNPWNATEVELYNKYSYKNGEESIEYTGKIYADGDKLYGFVGGIVYELTQGTAYSYADGENTVIVVDESRVSIDGKFYYTGAAEPNLLTESSDVCYYEDDEGNWVVFEGAKTPDNTKGYVGTEEGRTALIAVYPYTHPNDGESTYPSESPMTNVIVDYNTTITYTTKVGNSDTDIPEGKYHITAYVSKPGSLRYVLARLTELGSANTGYNYAVANVTALTLSGDVNYADIGQNSDNFSISDYGHVTYWDNEQGQNVTPDNSVQGSTNNIMNNQAAMNSNALTYLDLENAVFAVQTDMQFAKVNEKLVTVKLPTHESMTLIPDNAFNNLQQVSELCIPYNYTTIGSCAFYNTHALMHIYTTDNPEVDSDDKTIVDNGPYTYTFSANLKQIEGGIGEHSTFFGNHIEDVTDIYVLAEEAPLCGANAFAGSMTYGNNGFAGNWTHPICRENYNNGNRWICVLHYPSSSTDEEAAKYTDITRNYTLIDEVGNVDGDGRPIAWPRHAEFKRAYEQALKGYIWYDWKEYAEGATEVIQIYDASIVSANPTKYDQAYQGWHEFVLVGNSRSRDFDPQKENREYIQRDWYTICVPYDLTKSQLLNMLGVVNSEDDETVYALEENEGKWEVSETGTTVTQNLYPDVRALTHVSRDINENGTYVSGKVTLHLSEPLIRVDENGNVTCSHVDINEDGQGYTHATLEGDDPIVMEGGHAYLIRPYVPKEWNDQIKNLGMYIMAMADSYNNAAVSAGLPAPYSYNEDCKFENKVYLPCFKHKIHAVKGNGSPNASARNIPEFVYEDAEGQSPAYYRFVGTYTQTTVPQYAYYLGKNKTTGAHQFFRTTKETTKWNPYSAVIVGLSSNPNYTGVETSGQTGIQSVRFVSDSENDLRALAGEVTNPSNAGKSLSFEQLMGDANGEATGIVDVNVSENVNVSNNKVYSINGQYMGTSLNNLPKGIYIINGQKKVVK